MGTAYGAGYGDLESRDIQLEEAWASVRRDTEEKYYVELADAEDEGGD